MFGTVNDFHCAYALSKISLACSVSVILVVLEIFVDLIGCKLEKIVLKGYYSVVVDKVYYTYS